MSKTRLVLALCAVLCLGAASARAAAPTAASSPLYYEENFFKPKQPLINETGGVPPSVQAGNFGKAPTSFNGKGKFFGDYFPKNSVALPALDGVTDYGDFNMIVPTGCPTSAGKCNFEAVTTAEPTIEGTYQIGETTYDGIAVFVPAHLDVPDAGWEIQGLHFTDIFNGSSVEIGLFDDHAALWMDSGLCTSSGCEAHIKSTPSSGCPTVTTMCIAATNVIPKLVPGTWNEIVLGTTWKKKPNGAIQAWWKTRGQTTWKHSVNLTNIPTAEYESNFTPNFVHNGGPLVYGPAATATTTHDIHLAGAADGFSKQTVEATIQSTVG